MSDDDELRARTIILARRRRFLAAATAVAGFAATLGTRDTQARTDAGAGAGASADAAAASPAEQYRALREAARAETDAGARERIDEQLEALGHKIGLVLVRAECEANPVTVLADGERVSADEPIALSPGAHVLSIECAMGGVRKQVMVSAGERVEIEVPVTAWGPAPVPCLSIARDRDLPHGCGCEVVGKK